MINLDDIIRQLTVDAEAIRVLLQRVPEAQAQWKPDTETWSLKETMTHIYNEERIDFRKHLKEMLNQPPLPWQVSRPEDLVSVDTLQQALEGFLTEREASITWLRALETPDWDRQFTAPWGVISAGDVLYSWVEHDYLHMRQIIEGLHALNLKQAVPYSLQYAGDW